MKADKIQKIKQLNQQFASQLQTFIDHHAKIDPTYYDLGTLSTLSQQLKAQQLLIRKSCILQAIEAKRQLPRDLYYNILDQYDQPYALKYGDDLKPLIHDLVQYLKHNSNAPINNATTSAPPLYNFATYYQQAYKNDQDDRIIYTIDDYVAFIELNGAFINETTLNGRSLATTVQQDFSKDLTETDRQADTWDTAELVADPAWI